MQRRVDEFVMRFSATSSLVLDVRRRLDLAYVEKHGITRDYFPIVVAR